MSARADCGRVAYIVDDDGSIDITAIARSVLMIARDSGNPQIRYMYPIKSSLAVEEDVIGFRFGRNSGFQ